MTSQLDEAKGREIVARWCNLAEQRLEYLTELFDSGRWRRFYGEQAFLKDVREAKTAVDTWRELLSREASPDNRPIDLTWLGRGQTRVHKKDYRRDPAPPSLVAEIPIVPPEEIVSTLTADGDAVSETHSPEPLSEHAFAAVLDLASVAARYPVLRNTL